MVTQPETLFFEGISDHSPLEITISPKWLQKSDTPNYPRHIFKSPFFKERLSLLVVKTNLLTFEAPVQLMLYKKCMIAAAKHAKVALQFHRPDGEEQERAILETLARAVWRNDCKSAELLLRKTTAASQYVQVITGCVTLLDPASFSADIEKEKMDAFAARGTRLQHDFAPSPGQDVSPASRAKKSSKQAALSRLAKLWSPFNKRMVLTAIRIGTDSLGNHSYARTPDEQLCALRAAWACLCRTSR